MQFLLRVSQVVVVRCQQQLRHLKAGLGPGALLPRWLPHKVLAVPRHMGLSVGCLSVLTTWQPTPLRTSTQGKIHGGSDSTVYDLASEIIHLISTLSYSLEASDHDQPSGGGGGGLVSTAREVPKNLRAYFKTTISRKASCKRWDPKQTLKNKSIT